MSETFSPGQQPPPKYIQQKKEERSAPKITLNAAGKPVIENDGEQKEPGMIATASRAARNMVIENAMLGTSPTGSTNPMSLVLGQASTTWLVMKQVGQASQEGYKTGVKQAQQRKKISAFIPPGDLKKAGPETIKQLVKDLVSLSSNQKTTLDVNRRLNPTVVAERATRMIAMGSPFGTEINFPELGIRPSPNLQDAIKNYTRGGRSQLVGSGIVEKITEKDHKLSEEMNSPKQKTKQKEPLQEESVQKQNRKQTKNQNKGMEL